ncbi:hypothetical protein GLOIN_2v1773284 [Rhizophagus irregularis DAOM 181602=DAOM 197198]|nr:hypothetical protein GLOIN_2v1773284 [Rhizophagus irregularis DAOM 181602=DAOM 197198]
MIFTDLRGTTKETNEKRGTTIIYPIKLLKDEKENYTFVHNPETSHYRTRGIGIGISGICRFVEYSDDSESSDPRIYVTDNKCFVLKKFQYKNNVQLLEVYGLAKMKLETITKRVENSQNKLTRKYNRNIFSISKNKLYLCFT